MEAVPLGRSQVRRWPGCKGQRSAFRQHGLQKQLGRRTQIGRGRIQTGRASASRNGALIRLDMIASVLKRHRRLSLRELIAALDREFGWQSTESHVTALLYTNQKSSCTPNPIEPLIAPSPGR